MHTFPILFMIMLQSHCYSRHKNNKCLQSTNTPYPLRRRAAHFANYAADDDEEAAGALKDKAVSTCNSATAQLTLCQHVN